MNTPSLTQCPACGNGVSVQASGCPRCGQPLRTYAPAPFQPPAARKSGGVFKFLGIGCLGLFGFCFLIGLISLIMVPRTNRTSQSATNAAPSPSPTSSVEVAKKKKAKYKTKQQRIAAGVIEMTDENGDARGYSLTCWRQLTEDYKVLGDKKIPKGAQTAIFERCLEMGGDARGAMEEMRQFAELNGL